LADRGSTDVRADLRGSPSTGVFGAIPVCLDLYVGDRCVFPVVDPRVEPFRVRRLCVTVVARLVHGAISPADAMMFVSASTTGIGLRVRLT
jgi:hypothetical protein